MSIYFDNISFLLDLDELYSNSRGKELKENLRKKIEMKENANCSFHPKINDLSKLLATQSLNHPPNAFRSPDSVSLSALIEAEDHNRGGCHLSF